MPERSLTIEQVLTLLIEAPSRIVALTDSLVPAKLQNRPSPDEWSANDVLAHLRSCADVWGNCMREIIVKDKSTIRAINPTTWIDSTDYPEQKFHLSLRAFTAQRTGLLKILKPLTRKAWSRSATVTGAGAPLERTVFFYAQWLATHERTHIKQIARIVNAMQEINHGN